MLNDLIVKPFSLEEYQDQAISLSLCNGKKARIQAFTLV
jgi:hypothetical protein